MASQIKSWEIVDGQLHAINASLSQSGRTEAYDLESWIASKPELIGSDLVIIGRQVQTMSGPLDLLAIDHDGNLNIVELKRGQLPRESLAQAIDYASDVATWSLDKLREVCLKYTGQALEDVMADSFPDANLENLSINSEQQIILVGFSIESSLERMITWLSGTYGVSINAIVLHYGRTSGGAEVLSRTMVISEEVAEKRAQTKKFQIPMSDEPGTYDDEELRAQLMAYFSRGRDSARRIRKILLPLCLRQNIVTRNDLKHAFITEGEAVDFSKAGLALTVVSGQLGMEKYDFLRQVIEYDYPNNPWEKDNYHLREGMEPLVESILNELDDRQQIPRGITEEHSNVP